MSLPIPKLPETMLASTPGATQGPIVKKINEIIDTAGTGGGGLLPGANFQILQTLLAVPTWVNAYTTNYLQTVTLTNGVNTFWTDASPVLIFDFNIVPWDVLPKPVDAEQFWFYVNNELMVNNFNYILDIPNAQILWIVNPGSFPLNGLSELKFQYAYNPV